MNLIICLTDLNGNLVLEFSLNSEKETQNVFEKVKNQEKHHSKMTFYEEYILMLKAHKVEFLLEYFFKEME